MKIVSVSKCSLDIEQYFEFKTSVLISPSKSLISSYWVTNVQKALFDRKTQHNDRIKTHSIFTSWYVCNELVANRSDTCSITYSYEKDPCRIL